MRQNNLFEQRDHATIMILLTHFNFESASSPLHAWYRNFYSQIPIPFFCHISAVMFLLHQHFETDRKKEN